MGVRSKTSGEQAVPFLDDERPDEHEHEQGRLEHSQAIPTGGANDDGDEDEDDDDDDDDDDDEKRPPTRAPRSFGSSPWHAKSPRTIIFLVSLLKFLVAFCYDVFSLPIFRLIEDMYCHLHLKDDSLGMIEEMQCKVDTVQSQVAYMMGWLNLATSIISLIAALLFGTLADRVGRKPAIKWNCLGIVLSFPFAPLMLGLLQRQVRQQPMVLLLGSLFPLLGGGLNVLLATLYAVASDVSSEEGKATSFISISFGASLGALTGSLVGGGLLQLYGPWVPVFLVLLTILLCFVIIFFIPETLDVSRRGDSTTRRKTEGGQNALGEFRDSTAKALRDLVSSFRLLKNPNISLVLVYFLFHNARMSAYGHILPQYFSKNFGWQLGQISLLLSPLGIFNLVVLGVTPLASKLLVARFALSGFQKDLVLSRLCTLVFIVGAVIEGFTTSTAVFMLGVFIQLFGYSNNPLARATMTHYVRPELTSSLYMLISVVEVAGVVVGGPVLAWLFTFGMERGGVLTGTPWFYCAFFGGVIWLCLALVRPPRHKGERDCEEGAPVVEMKPLRAEERSSQDSQRLS